MSEPIDPQHFRHVLGHFPTGVAAVTSCGDTGGPVGMTVGSFISVSLSPPLVAFLPGKQSRTSATILRNGRFCVNVLGAHQEPASRAFATGGDRKFDGLDWTPSPGGLPRLDNAVAWIECTVDAVHDAGDHDIVIGRVTSLDAPEPSLPLLFFQGGYGRFAPLSLAAAGEADLVEHLRLVDVARPIMEDLAERNRVECLASAAVSEDIVLLATAGTPAGGRTYSRVGQRLPHIPPLGTALVAWSEPATQAWIARAGDTATRQHDPQQLVDRVRARGWSVATWSDSLRKLESSVDDTTLHGLTPHGRRAVRQLVDQLGSEHEPDDLHDPNQHYRIRSVSVPVFDARQRVVMQLTVDGLPPDAAHADVDLYVTHLTHAAERVSRALPDTGQAASVPIAGGHR
ncbi:flavin reductase [Amycolatopsis sp. H20-H5]|uniref:flavin reductase n=1 Tax=Amycolatopsis sp. H20-H5 TaxID=3046309 RepID=UPI002DB750CE|nr:flavin reductase [Amycolatopsis sp. H20-H5]MEC3978023.1 flavin reductase [Amycolatopsis sp. H20-H5]